MPGKKLLVADDSLTIQKVIRLALSNEGYDIQAVSDGNDALEQLVLFRPDVVLVDIALPEKSAFDLKRDANSQPDLTHTRFILMSSAFETIDEVQAGEVQFHGRLTKPFDPAHLREVIVSVLNTLPEYPKFDPPAEPTMVLPLTPPPSFPEMPNFSQRSGGEADIKHLTESTIRMSGLDEFAWSVQEPSLKPPPSLTEENDYTFTLQESPSRPSIPAIPAPPQIPVAQQATPSISDSVIESLVLKEIRNILPAIAEKAIKEEIRKMLLSKS